MALALRNLGVAPTLLWLLALLANLIITTTIVLALNYLFSVTAFYAPVQAEEITTYVRGTTHNLSTYPLSGMSLWVQLPLLTVLPAGLLGWFPTLALLSETPLGLPTFYPAAAGGFLVAVTVVAFQKGLQHYRQAGTNRYTAVGHRR